MQLCRCPHCHSSFHMHIPEESGAWDTLGVDEEGLLQWVCLDCYRQGLRPDKPAEERAFGHDTSYRNGLT